jgi:hypothetical protein
VEEDFYSAVLYECLVLDTPWNSGYPMESLLVTNLVAARTRAKGLGKGMLPMWRRTTPPRRPPVSCARRSSGPCAGASPARLA